MSAKSRRGGGAPAAHRKPAPRPASDGAASSGRKTAESQSTAARKPAEVPAAQKKVETTDGRKAADAAPSRKAADAAPSRKADAVPSRKAAEAPKASRRSAETSSSRFTAGRGRSRSLPFAGLGRSATARATGRYLRSFLPLIVIVVAIATVLAIANAVIPKPLTTEQLKARYQQIEQTAKPKWDAAQTTLSSSTTTFEQKKAALQSWHDSLQTYLTSIKDVGDWGIAKTGIDFIQEDGTSLVKSMEIDLKATSIDNLNSVLPQLYTDFAGNFSADRSAVRVSLGLPAAEPAAPTLPPSPSPSASGSAAASGSTAPSESPSASPAPTASAS